MLSQQTCIHKQSHEEKKSVISSIAQYLKSEFKRGRLPERKRSAYEVAGGIEISIDPQRYGYSICGVHPLPT